MIASTLTNGPHRKELADCVRRVNAAHAAAGPDARELPNLKEAWVRLDRNLSIANTSGDEVAARRAIETYEREAVAAIEEASK